jgi:hypothetical protein
VDAGPPEGRQEALDAQLDSFRRHPDDIGREWLLEAIAYLRALSATSALVNEHSALCWCRPRGMWLPRCFHSGDAETSDADYDERSEVFSLTA